MHRAGDRRDGRYRGRVDDRLVAQALVACRITLIAVETTRPRDERGSHRGHSHAIEYAVATDDAGEVFRSLARHRPQIAATSSSMVMLVVDKGELIIHTMPMCATYRRLLERWLNRAPTAGRRQTGDLQCRHRVDGRRGREGFDVDALIARRGRRGRPSLGTSASLGGVGSAGSRTPEQAGPEGGLRRSDKLRADPEGTQGVPKLRPAG